ncbi:MAG: hypothetical protein ACM34N_11495 [Ignavibacteria bacterium]
MKTIIKYFSVLLLIISFVACSEEPPSFRVKNDFTSKANLQIKTTANTENINDVEPGTITAYKDVAEGRVEVTAEIQNVVDEPAGAFNADPDRNYTVVITNANPPTIRIDVSDK